MQGIDLLSPALLVVLRSFNCLEHGLLATGNETDDHGGMRAEGGRTLGSVENPQPPTRSRPGIDQPTTGRQSGHRSLDDRRNGRKLPGDGIRNTVVLIVHDVKHLEGRQLIKTLAGRIPTLRGGEPSEMVHGLASCDDKTSWFHVLEPRPLYNRVGHIDHTV